MLNLVHSAAALPKRLQRQLARLRAYQAFFATPTGKLVIEDILERGGLFATSFDLRDGMTAFNEGKRALALEILKNARLTERDFQRFIEQRTADDE